MPGKQKLYSQLIFLFLLLTSCQAEAQPTGAPTSNITSGPTPAQNSVVKPTPTQSLITPEPPPLAASPAAPIPDEPQSAPLPTATIAGDNLVEQLIGQMTLEEKLGQLFMVHFDDPYPSPTLENQIKEMHVGGIILFSPNIEEPGQVATLINGAQQLAGEYGAGIPLFVAVDQEGWPVTRLEEGFTVFPSNMALGATADISHVVEAARITAQELGQIGVNMNLGPVLDVNNNPSNPIIGLRSFGAKPESVAELGGAVIRTYREKGLIATAKHFPGHGNTAFDSHLTLSTSNSSLDELQREELLPFREAISQNVGVIMTAHVSYPALDSRPKIPATLSKPILIDLLREEMGYTGLIATDSLGMGALDQQYGIVAASQMAFEAGADLLMFGNDPGHDPLEAKAVYDLLLAEIRKGNISEARVASSVRKILAVKAQYGLLEWAPVAIETVPDFVGTPNNLATAQDIARHSLTLIKNEEQRLPLRAGVSLAIISPESMLSAAGIPEEYVANILEIRTSFDPTPDEVRRILEALSTAAIDVVVFGTFNAPNYPGQVRLATALADYPTVVIALGLPYDLTVLPHTTTYLAAYGPSRPTLAVLPELLFGQIQPAGRLPVPISNEYPPGFGITGW